MTEQTEPLSAADRGRYVDILAGIRCQDLHDQIAGASCANCRSWARSIGVPAWGPMLTAAKQDARAEALAPVLALAEEWERSPWDWLRTTAAPALRAAVEDSGALARIRAEAWPCANYTAPVTCLHAGTTTPCDWCREAGAGAEQRGAARVKASVEAACTKAEALTQEAMGHVSEHWRGRDFADGLDDGIETTTGLVRAALPDADTTAHDRAVAAEALEAAALPVAAEISRRLLDAGHPPEITGSAAALTQRALRDRAAAVRQGGERE